MKKISLILFFASIAQIFIGFIIVAFNLPSGFIIFGYSPMCIVGGILILFGIVTLIAGTVLGAILYKNERNILALALNSSFLFGITLIFLLGFVAQRNQEKKSAIAMEKYENERKDTRNVEANKVKLPYLLNLFKNKILLVPTSRLNNNLGFIEINDYKVISVPSSLGGNSDKAIQSIYDLTRHVNDLLVLKLVQNESRDDLKKLLSFYDLNGVYLGLKVNGEHKIIKDAESEIWPFKSSVIEGINEDMKMYEINLDN